jgi:hypothetical protein
MKFLVDGLTIRYLQLIEIVFSIICKLLIIEL